MFSQIPFIGREEELAIIDQAIGEWGSLRIICINGPGGVGKTRLLQDIHQRYTQTSALLITNTIDLDDDMFHDPINISNSNYDSQL